MKKIFIIFLVCISCKSYQTDKYAVIEKEEIKSAFILNSSPTFKGYFYIGTDNDFHYFESRWKLQKDKYFKLNVEDLIIKEPYKLFEKELRIYVLPETRIVFGENDYYNLYIDK